MANIDFHAKKKRNCTIPKFELESLARCLLPDIQAFFESEAGRREFEAWKAQQERQKQ